MSVVNQFQGFGGNTGFNAWPNSPKPYTAPQKPLYDFAARPNGDCLKQVNGAQSASQYMMNPNSRDVLFDSNEDVF